LLKNGKECILRSLGHEDAESMLSYLKQIFGETEFMTRYPEEVLMTAEEEADFLAKSQIDPRDLMLCAVVDGEIIGSASLSCVMDAAKCRHRAVLGISVLKEYWNQHIGTALMTELIEWGAKAGYEQLELEVDCSNDQAVKLYHRFGFEIYGTRERSFKLKDGSYSSFYLMLRRLQ